jgi:hypothetical protein
MPNWCNNNVRLTHEDPAKLEEIVQVIKKSEATNEYGETTHYGLFEHIMPYPDEINNEWDWNWCVENWGTKWSADISYWEEGDSWLVLDFDTAYCPPKGIYEALVEQGYSVNAAYMECGMDFWGIWIDGCDDIGGDLSDYQVDKFGRSYVEWDALEEGSEGKGKKTTKTSTYGNGETYSWDEYEIEWEFDEEKSHEKALKIGITEEEWNRCELGNIRGG